MSAKRSKLRLRFVNMGIDIIDHNGEMIAGITEQDALDLFAAFKRNMKKIKRRMALNQ